jgi:hypothetical protein
MPPPPALTPPIWVLFAILFLWQFPHFYSIAWMYKEDYARAGIRMLPVVEPDCRSTARQIVLYGIGSHPREPASGHPGDVGPHLLGRRVVARPMVTCIRACGWRWSALSAARAVCC